MLKEMDFSVTKNTLHVCNNLVKTLQGKNSIII